MRSVIQNEKVCYVCGRYEPLHEHHIYYGYSSKNRQHSEELGLKVWLCPWHHNMSDEGVHFNKSLDTRLKVVAQTYYEQNIGTHEEFIGLFGRNYI